MLPTIARPVIGVLLARVALSFDRVHRATADEEQAATRLVRALERFRREGEALENDGRDEIRASAEGFIDAVRAKGRQWPRRARRPAVARASAAYRHAIAAAEGPAAADALAAADAALRMLVHSYPDLACEMSEPGPAIAPGRACVQLDEHREPVVDTAGVCPPALATG